MTVSPTPAELLGEVTALRRRARAHRHAYWFPLVLFGLLTCASVPFYVLPAEPGAGTRAVPGGPSLPILGGYAGFTAQRFLGYYWLAALLGGLLLTLSWLQHVGVLWPGDLVVRGTFPFVIIAAGLWVLAWAERSRALTAIAAVYTATALLASLYDIENVLFRLGWIPSGNDWRLTSLPNVLLPALVLLAAGAGAFAVQRRHRTTS
jgi:hypothetical protein